jgi:hypothetical protein
MGVPSRLQSVSEITYEFVEGMLRDSGMLQAKMKMKSAKTKGKYLAPPARRRRHHDLACDARHDPGVLHRRHQPIFLVTGLQPPGGSAAYCKRWAVRGDRPT